MPSFAVGEVPALALPKKTPMTLSDQYSDVLIEGVLRRTELLLLGGSAKRMKSWTMLDLLYCIISGFTWLRFPCHKGVVIHFDLELHEASLRERLELIHSSYCQAGFSGTLEGMFIVPLRNEIFGRQQLDLITQQLEKQHYSLLSIDPTYRFLLGQGENDPVAVCDLLNEFHQIANALGSAVALIQHFPKGNQSEKDAIDRFSGTGVWGRFPDSLLTLTEHQNPDCSSLNCIVRSFNQIEPFVVRWQFPRYRIEEQLDPEDLKTKPGPKKKSSAEGLCSLLSTEESISYVDFQRRAMQILQISSATFERRLREARNAKFIYQSPIDKNYALSPEYCIKSHRINQEPS